MSPRKLTRRASEGRLEQPARGRTPSLPYFREHPCACQVSDCNSLPSEVTRTRPSLIHSTKPAASCRSRATTRDLAMNTALVVIPSSSAASAAGALQGGPLEGLPGRGLEVAAEHFQQLAGHVPVVLLVPGLAQAARRIFKLGQELLEIAVPRGGGPATAAPPVVAEAVDGDRPEPGAKGPDAAIVLKLGQPADHDGHHFLHQVVGVVLPSRLCRRSQPRTSGS